MGHYLGINVHSDIECVRAVADVRVVRLHGHDILIEPAFKAVGLQIGMNRLFLKSAAVNGLLEVEILRDILYVFGTFDSSAVLQRYCKA